MDITLLLEMAADAHPDRVALGSRADGITYRQFADDARRIGGEAAGPEAEALALLDLNGPAFPALLFGAAYAGKPLCPLNYRLADDAVNQAVDRLAPVVLYAGESMAARVPARPGVTVRDFATVLDDAAPAATDDVVHIPDGERPAVYLFTSGTTGTPKIAVLRHRHLWSYIVSSVEFGSAGEDEAILVSVPNYHIAGIASVLSSVYAGRRIVYLSAFDPEQWVDTAAAEGITHAMVVPTMLGRILDVLEARGQTLPTLRHLSYGGGRMPVDVVERAMRLLGEVGMVNAYGLTETSSTIAVLGPEDHRAAAASPDPQVRARLGSVGRALPGVEIEIRDDDGNVVPPGEVGELYVRGEQVAGEYVSHKAVADDGWYPTRDHGYLDADGYLFLQGRADDVIVRGGENIAPTEVEDIIATHDAVEEVAVVGVPDQEWGERVEAVVVARPGAGDPDEIAAQIRDLVRATLRSTRVPSAVHFWDELPFNDTGKLLRRVVRERLSDTVTAGGTR
ncbi:AMP-dependent synthetase [Gordonia paraffinivorans]|uniref:class I adenylate-forming enzyme family protein n=1 Tax=Gordonia paraffinivorans TaxID=175628 RepID=UPI000D60FAF4|nr:class I adenylate-forming enzyme family protein [Gordonia paraffinivorans]MBY4572522.1 AMP-dependent synthetase [Gordonia paraffinivorans]PWD41618.1 AMP-dependent synthetase [Gordonia paraffinivorans]